MNIKRVDGIYSSGAKWESLTLSSQAIYMFCALAVVCDDYFVPSLEKLCEV